MIKRTLFGILLFLVIFAGSALSFNFIQNRNRTTRAVEGYNPTMDKAYVMYQGKMLNSMLGYTNTIDTSLYRDSIIPLDSSKQVDILLTDSVDTGADVRYELRSFDGSNLVEDGDLRFVKSGDIYNHYQMTIRMNLTTGLEYSLVIKVSHGNKIVNYYTRVVSLSEARLSGFLSYAESFDNAVFEANAELAELASDTNAITTFNVSGILADMEKEKEEAEADRLVATTTDAMAGVSEANLSKVFGSSDASSSVYDTENASYIHSRGNPGYVTLASSYEDIVFSGMKMERLSEPVPKIKELTDTSALIELVYKTISEENGIYRTYAVSEYLSLSYDNGAAAIKVSDYQRFVNQDFSADGIDPASNAISLGLTASEKPQYLASEDSKILAFVADNSLWIYDNSKNTYSTVYGTSSDEAEKERTPQEGYDIKLLSLDEDSLDFVVFGRINEGPREGSTGVVLYEYNIEETMLRELQYVASELPLDAMQLSVGELCYYDKTERVFYLLIGEDMLAIDVFSGKTEERISDLPSGHAAVSEDMKAIAYPDSSDLTKTKEIKIIDFEHRTEAVKKLRDHRLQLLGFVGEDIVYGAAEPEHISVDKDGTPSFLFDKLYIVHRDGSLVKKYERDNILISKVRFDKNVIYLTRKTINEETGDIVDAPKDYITYKSEISDSQVKVSRVENEVGNKETYLKFPYNVFVRGGNEELFTRVAASGNASDIKYDGVLVDKRGAFIYGPSGIRGVSDSVGKAINNVYENGGFVVDAYGATLYNDKIVRPYLTVAGTFPYKAVDNAGDSFAACNYMCMLAAGLNADYDEVRTKNNWIESFEMYGDGARGINISGVKLDTAIGYLSDGCPFAAKIPEGYVLVVSYNDDFIRYYDPMQDEEVRIQRYAFQLKCEDQENEFYTYVKK